MPNAPAPSEEHASFLDGTTWRIDSLYFPGPAAPLLATRASVLAKRLPRWAIAAGHTAGWLWTGLGRPEPWNLIAPTTPAISPLSRTTWKPRTKRLEASQITTLHSLAVLSTEACVTDLLTSPGDDDVAAAQLYALCQPGTPSVLTEALPSRLTQRQRDRARVRIARVVNWWRDHPVVTR